jgi:ElaB/YqjD/DUF883 family membrane-anchored ribosome-binding protein
MEHTNTSSENIADALKLLDHAAAQKKDELKNVLADKYTNLRDLIVENDSSLKKTFGITRDHALEAIHHAKDVSVAKAREVAQNVDKSVHENPWPYIGGALAVGALTGFLLGRSRK